MSAPDSAMRQPVCVTREGARNRLIGACREGGGERRWAERHGVALAHVRAVIAGEAEVSVQAAIALGLVRVAYVEGHPSAAASEIVAGASA